MESQILIKLSCIIDKMQIRNELKNIDKESNEEVAKELMLLLITNLYKAEQELYELISLKQGITIEEAKKYDAIKFIKDLMSIDGIKDFLE